MRRPNPNRITLTDRPEGIRVQKFLSHAGVASRRRAEVLLAEGRIRINGAVVKELGTRVDPDRDQVEVDGRPVRVRPPRWILLNKPAGVLTTRRDPGRRPTVYGLLEREDRQLAYVGRLDRDTEGLLILTNDGDVAHRLLHPSSGIEREYLADVSGVPDRKTLARLARGVELEDGTARAVRVDITSQGSGRSRLKLVMVEGRKREVRRLLGAVGHPVLGLARVRFGPQLLTGVAKGAWRVLTRREIGALNEAVDPTAKVAEQSRRQTKRRP